MPMPSPMGEAQPPLYPYENTLHPYDHWLAYLFGLLLYGLHHLNP